MTAEMITALIAGATGIFGGGGVTALLSYLQAKYKDRMIAEAEERKSRAENALTVLKLQSEAQGTAEQRPIDHFNELVSHLSKRVDSLEIMHKECTDHHAECKATVGELRGKLETLEHIVDKWFEKVFDSSPVSITLNDPPSVEKKLT